jgi:hypothetical protein
MKYPVVIHKDENSDYGVTFPDFKDGIWAIIEVDLSKLSLKSKRVNITMPERLLNSLDYFARKRGETRSGVLTKAATEYMSSHQ